MTHLPIKTNQELKNNVHNCHIKHVESWASVCLVKKYHCLHSSASASLVERSSVRLENTVVIK